MYYHNSIQPSHLITCWAALILIDLSVPAKKRSVSQKLPQEYTTQKGIRTRVNVCAFGSKLWILYELPPTGRKAFEHKCDIGLPIPFDFLFLQSESIISRLGHAAATPRTNEVWRWHPNNPIPILRDVGRYRTVRVAGHQSNGTICDLWRLAPRDGRTGLGILMLTGHRAVRRPIQVDPTSVFYRTDV